MVEKPYSIEQVLSRMFKKVMEYGHFETETTRNLTKVCFLGLNLHPNTDGIWNFDIFTLYKGLQKRGIEARIHDPHIKASQAMAMGVYLGRHSKDDNWSHSFDVIVLSCPHVYYIKNITQLADLFKQNKACMLLDLYGVFSKLYTLGDHIDLVSFGDVAYKSVLLGGLTNQPAPRLPNLDK